MLPVVGADLDPEQLVLVDPDDALDREVDAGAPAEEDRHDVVARPSRRSRGRAGPGTRRGPARGRAACRRAGCRRRHPRRGRRRSSSPSGCRRPATACSARPSNGTHCSGSTWSVQDSRHGDEDRAGHVLDRALGGRRCARAPSRRRCPVTSARTAAATHGHRRRRRPREAGGGWSCARHPGRLGAGSGAGQVGVGRDPGRRRLVHRLAHGLHEGGGERRDVGEPVLTVLGEARGGPPPPRPGSSIPIGAGGAGFSAAARLAWA